MSSNKDAWATALSEGHSTPRVQKAWDIWIDGAPRGHSDTAGDPAHESLLLMLEEISDQQRIANLIAYAQLRESGSTLALALAQREMKL